MEKILEALVDELAVRVAKRIAENHENMLDFLTVHPKPKLEDIEGLNDHIGEIARDIFDEKIGDVEVDIRASLSS